MLSGCLLVAVGAAAQVPATITVSKRERHRQAATGVRNEVGANVIFTVGFATTSGPGVVVEVRTPRDTVIPLERKGDGSFAAERAFDDPAQREAEFPDGIYRISVSGPESSVTNFSVASGTAVPATDIREPETLQSASTPNPGIAWFSIPAARDADEFSLRVARADGTVVFSSPAWLTATWNFIQAENLPLFVPLQGTLSYARPAGAAAALNNGATRAMVTRGFSVEFLVYCNPSLPVIARQPEGEAIFPGSEKRFEVVATGLAPISYQWKKDGAAIAGATDREFRIPVVEPAHAGTYVVEVANPAGRVASVPAPLAVGPALRFSIHAGQPGVRGSADGPNSTARFNGPSGMAFDPAGNLYVCEVGNNVVRKLTPAGTVSTLAGLPGPAGFADGTGAAARFASPRSIAVDGAGLLYVADTFNHVIRRITPSGVVTTIAGAGGQQGSADGAGPQARFRFPSGVAVDRAGNIFVADQSNYTVRKISPDGRVSTLAGAAGSPGSADGLGTAARFNYPVTLAVDSSGTVFVSEFNRAIRRISPDGRVTTFVRNFPFEFGEIAVDRDGIVHVAVRSVVYRFAPEGAYLGAGGMDYRSLFPGAGAAGPDTQMQGIAFDRDDRLFACDFALSCVLRSDLAPGRGAAGISIVGQPAAQQAAEGGSVLLSVEAAGLRSSYQWRRDGVPIAGATAARLFLPQTSAGDAGSYTVLLNNAAGFVVSDAAAVSFVPAEQAGRLVNLSVRARVGAGAGSLIAGFAIGGRGGAERPVLVRGIGPGLAAFGVTGTHPDPALQILRGTQALAANDDWGGGSTLAGTFAAAGAFPLAGNSPDAALTASLGAGSYSVQIGGRANQAGLVLAELYDVLGAEGGVVAPRLVNVSARAAVSTGADALIGGFVVAGGTSRNFLVRAVGPTLRAFGIADALADPALRLYTGSTLIASNDNWDDLTAAVAAERVGAFALSSRQDSALLLTLPPGAYSAQVSGAAGATGIVLLEVYEVP